MAFKPADGLDLYLQKILTRAREERLIEERRRAEADAEQLAARGLHGGPELSAAGRRAIEALETFGKRAISEGLGAIKEIYGGVPAGASDWLKEKLIQQFDSFASGQTARLTEKYERAKVSPRGAAEGINRVASQLKRDLDIELAPYEIRSRLAELARGDFPSAAGGAKTVDVFISHASEDKADVARPIADELAARGFNVWLDEKEIVVGNSLYESIDDGLRRCRFGIVILSPSFFSKDWPKRELAALAALGESEGKNKILPVWHGLDKTDIANYSPLLADIYATKTAKGLSQVVEDVVSALQAG